jgi:hypothetical protein
MACLLGCCTLMMWLSKLLWKVRQYLPDYTVLHSRWQPFHILSFLNEIQTVYRSVTTVMHFCELNLFSQTNLVKRFYTYRKLMAVLLWLASSTTFSAVQTQQHFMMLLVCLSMASSINFCFWELSQTCNYILSSLSFIIFIGPFCYSGIWTATEWPKWSYAKYLWDII